MKALEADRLSRELPDLTTATRMLYHKLFLLPVQIRWTNSVPDEIASAGVDGVREALAISGQERLVQVIGSATETTHLSAEQIRASVIARQRLKRDKGFGRQLLARHFLRHFSYELTDNPHWDVLMLNDDLTDPNPQGGYYDRIAGVTLTSIGVSVQSITRLVRQIGDRDLTQRSIRRLFRHETSHLLGLPARNVRVEQNGGLHCTDQFCTMRQGDMQYQTWVRLTEQEQAQPSLFCGDCLNDFTKLRTLLKPLPYLNENDFS